MKSSRSIEILCLALAAVVIVWSKALAASPWPIMGLLVAFAASIVLFRSRGFLASRPLA